MSETEPTIEQIEAAIALVANFACKHLPEDWTLTVECEHGACGVVLLAPEGAEIQIADDDIELGEMFVMRIDHARRADGLGETGLLEDRRDERFFEKEVYPQIPKATP